MADRPKLEIVHPGVNDAEANHVEFYIDGKFIAGGSRAHHSAASLAAIESVARHVARALGADIDVTDDPSPQPYVYFISYRWTNGYDYGPGQVWHTRTTPIEGDESLEESRLKIKSDNPERGEIVIANFILVDGPS